MRKRTTTVARRRRVAAASIALLVGACSPAAPAPVATSTSAIVTPSAGPVAAYGFEAGSGTSVLDSSGNGNTGTAANTTWSTAGKFGKALSFNGTNAWVTVPDSSSLDLTTGMTLEAWLNPTTSTGWVDAFGKETTDDVVYAIYSSQPANHPTGYIRKGGVFSEASALSPLTLNNWTHVATTYDGATLRFYVNGIQTGSSAATGAIDTSSGVLRIGGNSIFGEYFKGLIDEVRIYNTALSAAQITIDMNTAVVNGTQPPTTTPPATTPPTTTPPTTTLPTTTALDTTALAGSMTAPPPSRDAFLWPFAADSWVNTPLAATANYGTAAPFDWANINAESWSVNTGIQGDGTVPGGGSDAHTCIWNTAKTWIADNWNFGAYIVNVDARGNAMGGTTAINTPACAGLIRKEEFDQNKIPHALLLGVDQYLMSNNLKWPATSIDSDLSKHVASGLWYGALYAIPPGVNVTTLGLSPGGLTLAHALQDYGAVIVDQGANNAFCAEGRSAGTAGLAGARADVAGLMHYLHEVTNSTEATPGGGVPGSTRRAAPPPPFG